MSQEYTEDKDVSLKKLSSGRRLLEAILVVVGIFALYLMVALVSFSPSDPSWSQTAWHGPIHNLGGGIGAWFADTLFFTFGVLAYALPPIMLIFCWNSFRQRDERDYVDYFALSLRLIGSLALLLTSCGLAALNIDDLYYFASGGVIGSLLSNAVLPWFNGIGATLALLCVWASGLTLFTGWSWLTIAEKIGGVVMGCLTFMSNRSRHDEDDEYEDERYHDEQEQALAVNHDEALDDPLLSAPGVNRGPADAGATAGDNPLPSVPSSAAALNSQVPAAEMGTVTGPSAAALDPANASQSAGALAASLAAGSAASATPPAAAIAGDAIYAAHSPAHEDLSSSTDVPRYRFELPNTPAAAPAADYPLDEDQGPKMGNWQLTGDDSRTPYDFSVAQRSSGSLDQAQAAADTAAALTFMPAFSATGDYNPQVKQGIGPELPRPNPVRIPTRRELASYGIKVPSQQRPATPEVDHSVAVSDAQRSAPMTDDEQQEAADALHMAALQREFATREQQRYGEEAAESQDEDDLLAQRLAEEFRQQQSSRYVAEDAAPGVVAAEPSSPLSPMAGIDTRKMFDFSPLADLVDNAPSEPLFTPQPAADAEAAYQRAGPIHLDSDYQHADEVRRDANADGLHGEEPPMSSNYATARQPPRSVPAAATERPEPPQPVSQALDSLIHPFLMRNEQPLQKPTTPLPTLDLLTSPPLEEEPADMFALEQTARLVEARLGDYRVKAEVVGISPGPVITRFELDLAPGVKAARISNLSRDLARSLSAVAVRVVEVIPGKPYVGLELPNKRRQTVYLREVLDCEKFRDTVSPLAIVLGKDIAGQPVIADLAKMPHLLVAGTTGSGKSVGVNAMILSMLYKATPEEVRFIMIDPKMLELSVYEGIPHLLTEVVTDMKDAANALRWCVGEMERRYKLMSALGVRNLAGYNERIEQAERMGRPVPDPFWKPGDGMADSPPMLEKLPYIVVLVDEFADLMMAVGKKVEELIARLAQKARAAGIHLVLATQRPSVDVITGLIKANIPTRIAFTVSSKIDSRTILDQAGAESLLGMGDMLYLAPNSSIPVRVHGAFVRDEEVHAVVSDWKARGRPQYIDSITSAGEEGEGGAGAGMDGDEELDPLFDQAVQFVVDKRRASISGVQRQFRIGYNRAARIIEQMELQGIVSSPGHNGNREVLAPPSAE